MSLSAQGTVPCADTAFINKKIEAEQFRNASNEALRQTPKSGLPQPLITVYPILTKMSIPNHHSRTVPVCYSRDVDYSKVLTSTEWKKYNTSIGTAYDSGLRISDNSILVECENDSKYQYKYVVDDDFEDGPMITDVYAIGRINLNVEDNTASQCHNIARYINQVMRKRYDNRKNIRNLYRHFMQDTSYVLLQYNRTQGRFSCVEIITVEPSLCVKIHCRYYL